MAVLLDKCPCPRCLHPITRERTVSLVDDSDVHPASITTDDRANVIVDWGGDHVGVFPVGDAGAETNLPGRRHLQGCYVCRDMVESRLRRLSLR